MQDMIAHTRAQIARIGALLFARQLTDAGGGNISVRVEDKVCISPRYSGQKHLWQLAPDDVMVVDLEGNILEGKGELSRESRVHLSLHREFREYGSTVIHCHPRHVLVFCAAARPMPPALEGTLKFGTVPVIDFAPAHSPVLAENVTKAIRGQEARIRKHAAACIAPWHGLFTMGKDLNATFDAVERLDTNAYVLLTGQVTQEHLDALQTVAKQWDKQ
jgi:L-fuculose-phosphate aldolase